MQGIVFNIQRFSVHDGPGIRTTVFLKGCSLKCFWCHNPESIDLKPQIQFFSKKCIGCGKCLEVCPTKAHRIVNGKKVFMRELCVSCGRCVNNCCSEALIMTGKEMTVEEVINEVGKDRAFYENSGGGVTFSGGEPLLQKSFVKAFLAESKKARLHTAVDTAGNVPWDTFEEVLPHTDLFLYDVKAVSEEKHIEATGVSNKRILENLQRLCETNAEVWIRVPVITGVNADMVEMSKIADLVNGLKRIKLVELLPFNSLGEGKYLSLGQEYKARGYVGLTQEKMDSFAEIFKTKSLNIKTKGV